MSDIEARSRVAMSASSSRCGSVVPDDGLGKSGRARLRFVPGADACGASQPPPNTVAYLGSSRRLRNGQCTTAWRSDGPHVGWAGGCTARTEAAPLPPGAVPAPPERHGTRLQPAEDTCRDV